MTKLTGSEKQIAWAENIRQSFIDSFNEDLADDNFDDIEKAKKVYNFILDNADTQDYINSNQGIVYNLDVWGVFDSGKLNMNNKEYSIDEIIK